MTCRGPAYQPTLVWFCLFYSMLSQFPIDFPISMSVSLFRHSLQYVLPQGVTFEPHIPLDVPFPPSLLVLALSMPGISVPHVSPSLSDYRLVSSIWTRKKCLAGPLNVLNLYIELPISEKCSSAESSLG